jgi:DNA-directed RNA polymerase specialized sigma24 family protein
MPEEEGGSVTRWIGDLKAGGDIAAQHLWERYFDRLVHLARNKLRGRARSPAVEDEEDAALSAFDSFCRGASAGRFPVLTDRDDLWRLLVVLTLRKAADQLERQGAVKRGGRQVAQPDVACSGEEVDGNVLDQIVGREPTPELAVMVIEQYRRVRSRLGDATLQQVLDLRLEGYDRQEIAVRLGCAVRTVTRKLDVIRQLWLENEK